MVKGYDVCGKTVVKLTKSMIFLELPLHYFFSLLVSAVCERVNFLFLRGRVIISRHHAPSPTLKTKYALMIGSSDAHAYVSFPHARLYSQMIYA